MGEREERGAVLPIPSLRPVCPPIVCSCVILSVTIRYFAPDHYAMLCKVAPREGKLPVETVANRSNQHVLMFPHHFDFSTAHDFVCLSSSLDIELRDAALASACIRKAYCILLQGEKRH